MQNQPVSYYGMTVTGRRSELISFGFSDRSVRSLVSAKEWSVRWGSAPPTGCQWERVPSSPQANVTLQVARRFYTRRYDVKLASLSVRLSVTRVSCAQSADFYL